MHDVVKSFLSSYAKEQLIVEDKEEETSEEKDKDQEKENDNQEEEESKNQKPNDLALKHSIVPTIDLTGNIPVLVRKGLGEI